MVLPSNAECFMGRQGQQCRFAPKNWKKWTRFNKETYSEKESKSLQDIWFEEEMDTSCLTLWHCWWRGRPSKTLLDSGQQHRRARSFTSYRLRTITAERLATIDIDDSSEWWWSLHRMWNYQWCKTSVSCSAVP